MSKITTHQQLRDAYASFWESKSRNHVEGPPIRLVPENDPTTLFTGSGMQQFVPNLLGEPHPLGTRLYNIQRSFRAQDIEEVGDNRHTTFFEMMGNWSLGDYFKKEQLSWFWEFITKELGLPKDKLYVTCFEGNKDVPKDTESETIWKQLGVADDHIHFYDASKNWWSRAGEPSNMPAGEIGGPDSEIFYEFTDVKHDPSFGKKCHPNCDCGRFLEIGNSVFIQYKKEQDGSLSELPNKNVDFGGGLERMLAAVANDPDVFKTDAIFPIIQSLENKTHTPYGSSDTADYAYRVIADHIRAATVLIADGVMPSNSEQGYVARRLIRRSIQYAKKLGLTEAFTQTAATAAIKIFTTAYPHVAQQQQLILETLGQEEEKFNATLERGLKEFHKIVNKQKTISGKDAFFLYETYGFPVEMTQELAEEQDVSIDMKGFEDEKKRHQDVSRKGMDKKFRGGLADTSEETVKLHTATHLLHHALREVLGDTVQQKGSNITGERLRFDFSFSRAMTDDEKQNVKQKVNKYIQQEYDVWNEMLPKQEAEQLGALAFFGEKYADTVSVYFIGKNKEKNTALSKEFCGGPHVTNTKQLGTFKLQREKSAGAGIRRIYAILE
jgi:alanyl-tRNA synthetase